LFASYLGVGSKAHRPDLMLKIALYEIQTGQGAIHFIRLTRRSLL